MTTGRHVTAQPRALEEFYCSECRCYFMTHLRKTMNGNFTIECPSCQHHHFRVILEGVVTSDRCNNGPHGDIIMGLRATLSKKPRLQIQHSIVSRPLATTKPIKAAPSAPPALRSNI